MLSFWSGRPTRSKALLTLAVTAVVAAVVALIAARTSPRVVRGQLPLERGGLDEIFLTELADDASGVLLTSRRENATWSRGFGQQPGDRYWIRRYGDPARPGLPTRILLGSRTRGAHLLIPVGALDLERALAACETTARAHDVGDRPEVRCELAQVYWNRSFAGVYLHLRFPKRPPRDATPDADLLDYDLVVVRGNRVRTTDFLLQPNGELYRHALTAGVLPAGDFVRSDAGTELVATLWDDAERVPGAFELPLSLFDELGLCWGDELATLIDDRWRIEALAAPVPERASSARRATARWNITLHLAARFESAEERERLQRAVKDLEGS